MDKTRSFSLKKFFELEAAGGILLLIAGLIAFLWANSSASEAYFNLIHRPVGFSTAGLNLEKSLSHWVNDALMVLFFFIVGLEIKRELLVGELSTKEKALLPILCAVGGAVVPAGIYLFLNPTGEAHAGWGIPMATDIAFAVGILTLFGSRVPTSLKVFLLALAVVDDLIAILVIAFFYTTDLSMVWLAAAFAIFGVVEILKRLNIHHYAIYIFFGILAWFAVFQSGIHATIAGVLLGLMTPINLKNSNRLPLNELVRVLHPWTSFVIMPIFAFFNAGVNLDGVTMDSLAHPVFLGIFFGLLIGKPLGILGTAKLITTFGWSPLPDRTTWRYMTTVGFLGGIGFTMSLFVQELGLKTESLHVFAKSGILTASLASAVVGLAWGFLTFPKKLSSVKK